MTGQRITVGIIHVNPFPLFADAREIRVFDDAGKDILVANRVKCYVDLTGLASKYLTIRLLVISEPKISADRPKVEEIVRNVKVYLEQDRKAALKVKVKVIEVVKADASFRDDELKGTAGAKGLAAEIILGENPRFSGAIKELAIEKEGWPKIICDLKTTVALKGERLEIKRLEIGSYGSTFKGEGSYSKGDGLLKTRLTLLVDSVKRLFNLRQKGEGMISVRGDIRIERATQR